MTYEHLNQLNKSLTTEKHTSQKGTPKKTARRPCTRKGPLEKVIRHPMIFTIGNTNSIQL